MYRFCALQNSVEVYVAGKMIVCAWVSTS